MAEAAKSLKVFVSYSRTDVEFADQLVLALEDRGFEAILDRHDMSGGENWRERLGRLILSADAVTFILTAKSASSEICAWEVEEAARLGKRILPVTYSSVAGVTPPRILADLNWIPFWADPAIPGAGFYYGVKRLMEALSVDLDWLRSQTRYSERAAEWTKGAKVEDLLLRGEALKEAHAWLGRTPAGSSPPDSVRAYLGASSDAEQRREVAARVQLVEREQALKTAEAAVAERQAAVSEKAKSDRRLRLLAVVALVVGVGLVGTALAGLWYAGVKAAEAGDRRAALFAQAGLELCREGECNAGMLLAVAGDPAAKESVFETALRPEGYPVLRTALVELFADDRLVYQTLTGQAVRSVAALPDGKHFATFHSDKSVRIWAADKPDPIRTFSLPATVARAAFFADGERVLIRWDAYAEPTSLWSLTRNQAIRQYGETNPSVVALSPDEGTVLLGGSGGAVEVWPVNGDRPRSIVKTDPTSDYAPSIRSLAFSEDGKRFAAGDEEGVVTLWSTEGDQLIASVKTKAGGTSSLLFVPKDVAGSDGGGLLLGGSGDGRLVTVEGGPGGRSENLPGFSTKTGQDAISITDLVLDGDRGLLLMQSEDARATLLRVDEGATASGLLDDRQGTAGALLLPEANALVTASVGGAVSVWKFEAAEQSVRLTKGLETIAHIIASPDGQHVLSVDGDLGLSLWRPGDTKPLRVWSGTAGDRSKYWSSAMFSPDGRKALGVEATRDVTIWDVENARQLQVIPSPEAVDAMAAAFLPDGSGVILFGRKSIRQSAGGPKTSQTLIETWKFGADKPATHSEGKGDGAYIHQIAVHPDGQQLLVATQSGVDLWRLGASQAEAHFATGDTDSVAWHPDGQRFATGLAKGDVELWRIGAAEPEQLFKGHNSQVLSIVFNAAGDRMLTAGADASARLWQLGQRNHLQKFEGFDSVVRQAWFDADGRHVWTGSLRAISRWRIDPILNEPAREQARLVCERLVARSEDEIWPELRQRYPMLDDRIADRPCEAMGLVKARPKPKADTPAPASPAGAAGSAPD